MDRKSRLLMTLGAGFVTLGASAVALAQEQFDEAVPPNNWNLTIFKSRWPQGGAFSRDTLAGVAGIPGPPAVISTGVDREGVYHNTGAMTHEAYALMDTTVPANYCLDSVSSSFVQLDPLTTSTTRTTVGLMARTNLIGGAPMAFYGAVLSCQPGSTIVYLRLVKDADACLDCAPVDNIIDTGDTLVGPIISGTNADNYFLTLDVLTVGATAQLTATAQKYRVNAAGAFVPYGLVYTAGPYVDGAPLGAGYNGVIAMAANGDRACWDQATESLAIGGGGNPNPGIVPPATDYAGFSLAYKGVLAGEVDVNGDGVSDTSDIAALFEAYITGR